MESKLPLIVQALKDKACMKQSIYRKTLDTFSQMKGIAEQLAVNLSGTFKKVDKTVKIEYKDVNKFEFRLKFSGDMLIFTMHSNVTTFPADHVISKNPYVQEDPRRGYFGHIMIYNFMADSIRYQRLNDPGYLIARMMVNLDGHFYIEGVRQLNFLYPDISENQVAVDVLLALIESSMLAAIGSDLYVPNYQDIQVIPLGQKIQNQMVSGGQKVGFQMSTDRG